MGVCPGNQTFVAELTVPLRNKGEVFVAVGQGPNKAEAERACCTAACAKLYDVGLLQKPNDKGYSPPFTAVPASNKAAHNQQVSFVLNVTSFIHFHSSASSLQPFLESQLVVEA